jgi:hypothetical protein
LEEDSQDGAAGVLPPWRKEESMQASRDGDAAPARAGAAAAAAQVDSVDDLVGAAAMNIVHSYEGVFAAACGGALAGVKVGRCRLTLSDPR